MDRIGVCSTCVCVSTIGDKVELVIDRNRVGKIEAIASGVARRNGLLPEDGPVLLDGHLHPIYATGGITIKRIAGDLNAPPLWGHPATNSIGAVAGMTAIIPEANIPI